MLERIEEAIRSLFLLAGVALIVGYFSYSFGHKYALAAAPEIAEQRREADARADTIWERMNAEPPSAEECLAILRFEIGLAPE